MTGAMKALGAILSSDLNIALTSRGKVDLFLTGSQANGLKRRIQAA